jgi:hypothetical protein
VLVVNAALAMESDDVYDAQRIFDRAVVIAVAIDARAQRCRREKAFRYRPFEGLEDDFRWNAKTFERVVRDYNLEDLVI